jgi:hypothetical protein
MDKVRPESQSEHTPVRSTVSAADFRSVVDDPVARAAPAPADIIIDRPTSIVAPNQNLRTTIPLKRNGDGAAGDLTIESCGRLPLHQPGRSSRSSRSVCIAPPSLARGE